MADGEQRFPRVFWLGALAGGGLGLFAGVWFCEQWWHGLFMPIREAIGIIKVLAALITLAAFVAVGLRRRGRAGAGRRAEPGAAADTGRS